MRYPKRNSDDPKEQRLAEWLSKQRCLRRQGKLSLLRANLMEELPQWSWGQSCGDADESKQQLLKMARNEEDRPLANKHPLGVKLSNYTNPNSTTYDPQFDKEIRKLRPDWFDMTWVAKQQLLAMARNGEDKPQRGRHRLADKFSSYITRSTTAYDPQFDKKIRKLRPDWFIDTAKVAKQQLLKMARNGEYRPVNRKHPLGEKLSTYTTRSGHSYDPQFDKKIRKLRPDWFDITVEQAKQQLLSMARNGEDRPSQSKHLLGRKLCNYTNPNNKCYDKKFDKEIRKLRPDWFQQRKAA